MDGNAYGAAFARVHQLLWADYADVIGPRIAETFPAERVLDLCCGSGELARCLAARGMRVTGLDASEETLALARRVASTVEWVRGDASCFQLAQPYHLVTCVSHSLQHLADPAAIQRCFRSTRAALTAGGRFVFDLLTRSGLEGWTAVSILDEAQVFLLKRGLYDKQRGHAHRQLSGFIARSDDVSAYDRFDVLLTYQALAVDDVRAWLLEAGFATTTVLDSRSLRPIDGDVEQQRDLLLVAET